MAAKVVGCSQVIAVDVHESRLELAKELGATDTINTSRSDLVTEVMERTGGRGADYIFDTTARPELLTQAAGALAIRGTLALVGAAAPGTTTTFEVGASPVKGWTFKNDRPRQLRTTSVRPQADPALAERPFPFDKLIKHYHLEETNQAFTDFGEGPHRQTRHSLLTAGAPFGQEAEFLNNNYSGISDRAVRRVRLASWPVVGDRRSGGHW